MSDISLLGLFLSSFISSTLFPGGSEVVLAYLSSQHIHQPWMLLTVATVGNTLGGMTSWGIGWLIARKYPTERILKEQHQKAVAHIKQYGGPILLFSWLPVIGDPLCVSAGWLHLHWFRVMIFIGAGKALRYWIVLYLFSTSA